MILNDKENILKKIDNLEEKTKKLINNFLKFYSYSQKEDFSRGYPSIWDFETTNKCNMTCNHCIRTYLLNRPLKDMDFVLLKKIINQLKPYAQTFYNDPIIQFMHFGEPTYYKYYSESIEYAHSKGFKVIISSTSSAISDQRIIQSISSSLDTLWLIFDGMTDEVFSKIRGPYGSFTKGIAQLDKLLKLKDENNLQKPDIIAIMIKHPYNRHQWQDFCSYFSQKKSISYYLANFSSYAGNVPEINKLKKEISDDIDGRKKKKGIMEFNKKPCYYPWHSLSILVDGTVVPCCRDVNGAINLGNLNNKSLIEIWNDEPIRKLRNKFLRGDYNNPLCKNCQEHNLEIRVPANYELYYGKYLLQSNFPDYILSISIYDRMSSYCIKIRIMMNNITHLKRRIFNYLYCFNLLKND